MVVFSSNYDRYKADFSQYEPHIVPHKSNPKLLFCKLTQLEINRIPVQVEAHVKGKRFQNRKQEKEGLKESQRLPAKATSDDEFWVSVERSVRNLKSKDANVTTSYVQACNGTTLGGIRLIVSIALTRSINTR